MKLQILQEKIKKGIGVVERVSSKSLSLPILNNILISTKNNFLNMAATDLEIGINWWNFSKTDKEGKITVPAHLLSSFIGLLPNDKINISSNNDNLFIECGKSKTEIKGISAEEFPIIPKIDEGEYITVNTSAFCFNLSQVVDIAASSTTRPEISGVFLGFSNNLVIMVATDSFRLAEKKVFPKTGFSLNKDYNVIIPQRAAKEIINIFGGYDKDLKIYFSANQIMFEVGMDETPHPHIQLISRLIEGEYPNYKEIIPDKYLTQILINRNEFLNQIKTASFFAGKINEVRIKADPKKKEIEIMSQSPEIGKYESTASANIKGEPVEISFNHKYLLDGVVNIKSSELKLELSGDAGPGLVKPIEDDTYRYVVMPIKAN